VEENEAPDNQLPHDVEIAASRCHAIGNTGMPQSMSVIIACQNFIHRFVKKMTKGLFFDQFSAWIKFNPSGTFILLYSCPTLLCNSLIICDPSFFFAKKNSQICRHNTRIKE
jgi:hypothetical protein